MGIGYSETGGVSAWAQENRLQLNFNVAVEADHGLTFGAFSRVRITNGGTAVTPLAPLVRLSGFSGSRVWVEASGFRLTFGNVDGAFRGAGVSHGYLGGCGVGYEGGQQCGDAAGLLGVTQGFVSQNGGPTSRVRVDYTMGDTRFALSHDRGSATEIGVRTRFDAFDVAFGYTNGGAMGNSYALSGHYNGGAWGAGLLLARVATGAATSVNTYSLSGNVALGGGSLYGYIGRVPTGVATTGTAYGLNYGYGLGGGATLTVGAERVAITPVLTTTTASVGVAFNF